MPITFGLITFYLRSLQDAVEAIMFLVPFNHPLLWDLYLNVLPPAPNRFPLASGD